MPCYLTQCLEKKSVPQECLHPHLLNLRLLCPGIQKKCDCLDLDSCQEVDEIY